MYIYICYIFSVNILFNKLTNLGNCLDVLIFVGTLLFKLSLISSNSIIVFIFHLTYEFKLFSVDYYYKLKRFITQLCDKGSVK